MLIALCVMGTLLGFSVAVNIVMFVAYGQQVKEISRMKFAADRAKIGIDIENRRKKLQEEL